MDFVNNTQQVGRISPFRFWCQKVLPAVYDDSLSYYELLCKVLKYLNELIEVSNTQSDAITELQELVQSFIEGTFDPYIEEKIDEWFTENEPEIMAELADLQTQINTNTTNLQNQINTTNSTLQTEVTKLTHWQQQIKGTNLVVFGDSYAAPNIANSINAYYPNRLKDTLGSSALFNYAIAGAGWARNTQPISRQCDNCDSEMTQAQKENTGVVVCMAGCNDLLNYGNQGIDQASIAAGIRSFISWAALEFKNARIIVVPFNWGFGNLTQQLNTIITNVMNNIMNISRDLLTIVPYAWVWNLGLASHFQNQVHPNELGYQIICQHINQAIFGGPDISFTAGNILTYPGSYFSEQSNYYNVRDGVLYINGWVKPSSSLTRDSVVFVSDQNWLPPVLTPKSSFYIIPLISSTTGQHAGFFEFRANGRMVAYITSNIADGEVLNYNYSHIVEVGVSWSDYQG